MTPIPKEDPMTEAEIAQRRIETLTEQGMYGRRDTLRAQLEERGLSRVAETELHMLEESIMQLEQAREEQQQDEIAAEDAWLRAAEYDPRMDDPREW